jgi:hypothetical protein
MNTLYLVNIELYKCRLHKFKMRQLCSNLLHNYLGFIFVRYNLPTIKEIENELEKNKNE